MSTVEKLLDTAPDLGKKYRKHTRMSNDIKNNFNESGLGAGVGRLEGHRVVVFGGSGLIGRVLCSKVECDAPSRLECDLTDFNSVQRYIERVKPTLAINLSGESKVDRCNSDHAWSINTHAVTNICYALASHCKGAKFFQAGSINQVLSPNSSYAKQKSKAAAIANSYSKILDVIDAKLCTTEGGFRAGFIISDMIRMLKTYSATKVQFRINDMSAKKWVVDVDSMAEAIIRSCETESGGSFYFGPSSCYSLEEIFCEACSQMGINTVKNGKNWMDADNGRVIMSTLHYSNPYPCGAGDFGTPYGGGIRTNLPKIVNSIILSS